ncbi:MAG: DUF1599 domain-containing protein [Chitinophagaceae bacterium]|nr:MAG: DUF1599 domain-containing protein [Chitinophagaceae bacterium]
MNPPERAVSRTPDQYDAALGHCHDLFAKKTKDYGTAWRVLRPISIVDQIFIKAQRIRTIQEKGAQRIGDDIRSEFIGIANYAIIGLIQLQLPEGSAEELPVDRTMDYYERAADAARALMHDKNHDYGEAWRSMSQESFTDLILMKLARIRQILANKGQTLVSEGIDANYYDILNYALFALILMDEGTHK